ncbi:hypothetical protein AVEN_159409-1 [Araneus ventricosus]|uniref:Uncharacterized protein n=1 Tax=Araneus ventricosus TaxID=182803 RepID=A0A4Y2A2A0_ARAVE|nr:hypothetical protein AVEN_159409-1 [Araneus ventricosus]
MTWMTPKPTSPLHTTAAERRLALRSSLKSCFEPEIFRHRSRNLTIRPPRPCELLKGWTPRQAIDGRFLNLCSFCVKIPVEVNERYEVQNMQEI